MGVEAGQGAMRDVLACGQGEQVARGGGERWMGPWGCQVRDHPKVSEREGDNPDASLEHGAW